MSFFPSRWAFVPALAAALALGACGDDEDDGAGGAGGQGGSGTTSTSTSTTTGTTTGSSTGGQGGEGGGTGEGGAGGGEGGGGEGGSGGAGGAPATCAPSATSLELEAFRTTAAEELAAAYPGVELGEVEIFFQDMINGVGLGAANEFGQLCGVAALPAEHQPLGKESAAWCISIGGFDRLRLVFFEEWGGVEPPDGYPTDEVIRFAMPDSGLAGAVEGTDEAELQAIADALEAELPSATTSLIPSINLIIFSVDPVDLGPAFDFLQARADIAYVEGDGEVYADPYFIGPAVSMEGEAMPGKATELYDWAYLSQQARIDEGVIFANVPSLPPPWGPGRVDDSLDREFEITVADGADRDACFAEAKACYAFEDGGSADRLADPEFRAASLYRLDCVDAIAPNEPTTGF